MKILNCLMLTIGIIGTLNWGLIGLFSFNLVAFLFGNDSFLANAIYILVGISGLYMLMFYTKVNEDTL